MEVCIKKPLFGKHVEIALFGIDASLADSVAENAYQEGLRGSKVFSIYDSDSEVSRLNKKRKTEASSDLLKVLKRANTLSAITGGAYDVTLGRLIRQRKSGAKESAPSGSFRDITIKGKNISLKNPDIELDFGSIAKGYIVDCMVKKLKSDGVMSALIDARGDIGVFGNNSQVIGIEHPRKKGGILHKVRLRNEAVATSGDYNQYYGNDFSNCHIINRKDAISVTVIAPTLVDADAFATALFVSSPKEREIIMAKNKSVIALVVDENMGEHYYNGFEARIVK